MAWQDPQQAGWPMKDPIMTQVNPGMAMPMDVISSSHKGGSTCPPLEVPGMPQSEVAPSVPMLSGGSSIPNPNRPTGLECLMNVDTLFVQQQLEILEVITGWETINKYIIKNSSGQALFYVEEESNFCARYCCGKYRPFVLKIINNTMREVITVCRPFRSDSCLCPCFLQEMEVFVNGIQIGTVVQDWNCFQRSFSVCDLSGDTVLKIKGPLCTCPFFSVNFKVLSSDGQHQVGRISKKWTGLVQEVFTNADVFGVNFPMDLNVKIKALLMTSCLLIDADCCSDAETF